MAADAKRDGTGERQSYSLDGAWTFTHEQDGRERTATVPNPWQAEFADLRQTSGTGVYSRTFSLPAGWAGGDLALMFGAVSYFAEVRLNGHLLGTHEGSYLPFEFIVPAASLEAENTLEVRATLPTADREAYPDFPFAEIPHGKQSWYGPLAGIWQSVRLETRGETHLAQCRIHPDALTGSVEVSITLAGPTSGATLKATIVDETGGEQGAVDSPARDGGMSVGLHLSSPRLWSPDSPQLYTLQLDVMRDGRVLDSTRHSFGFRTVESREGKLLLNGKPFYMRGALDQDYYPEGICTPPSLEFLEDQLRKAKALGLNLLRCHIKVPDPRYYEVADRLGMLIWTEIPNTATLTAASARRLRDTMSGILARDGNHPSIICWTIINEDWGTRLVEDASHRTWLKETFDWLKAEDPTRLVVDNSACIPNFHVKTDINDYHYYRSVPERRGEWEQLTAEFAAGASWTYSPHGDAERRGDEPLVVSEFGVWGLPDPGLLAGPNGGEPWWMETGQVWGDGSAYPHGIQERFSTLHLDTVFGSFSQFITSVQWYQFENLKYEIESMRAHAPIVGYVITELTDVHWEANGLMDIDRNPRVFSDRFAEINTDIVIVPKLGRYAGTAGQPFSFAVSVSTGGSSIPRGAELSWSLAGGASGRLPIAETASMMVVDLGLVSLALPRGSENRMAKLDFELSAGGGILARNSVDVAIYAPRPERASCKVATSDNGLALYASALGYELVPAGDADVILARALDRSDIAAMQAGARYLVLADGTAPTYRNLRLDAPSREQPFMPVLDGNPGIPGSGDSQVPNIWLHPRHGTMWRGDWIASFSWIRRGGAFASLPGGPMLDLSFSGVVPHHVMTGFRTWEYEGLVHSGVVVGWVQKPAAFIAERRVGHGGLVGTTFRLTADLPGADPVAAALFDALVVTAAQIRRDAAGQPQDQGH